MGKKDNTKPEKVKTPKVKEKKEKKDKKSKGGAAPAAVPPTGAPADGAAAGSVPLSQMAPDQMNTMQLEQAIKESSDPNNRLKKLRSPLNVRSCLLNILILIVLTFLVVLLWTALAVDKFNFATVMGDMMEKFHITQFFKSIGTTIAGWFS